MGSGVGGQGPRSGREAGSGGANLRKPEWGNRSSFIASAHSCQTSTFNREKNTPRRCRLDDRQHRHRAVTPQASQRQTNWHGVNAIFSSLGLRRIVTACGLRYCSASVSSRDRPPILVGPSRVVTHVRDGPLRRNRIKVSALSECQVAPQTVGRLALG